MNICGIITEYNPLHLGHAYQIEAAKEHTKADATLLIMSGNFVQRGEPAILNKFARAKSALQVGIDLVLELPTYFATSSAEAFSHMAIKMLDDSGITTHLNFGSESGDIRDLNAIASLFYDEPIGFKFLLNDFLSEGHSFPKAREMALLAYNDNHHLFSPETIAAIQTPNNILGIEYIKALKRLESSIQPTTIKRIGSMYHDDDSTTQIPSATAVRKHLFEGRALNVLAEKLPLGSYNALLASIDAKQGPIHYTALYPPLKYKLLSSTPEELSIYMDVNEGLEYRIHEAARHTYDYDSLVAAILSKRYTKTKVARALLHIFLGLTKSNFITLKNDLTPYMRVLGFNSTGQEMLRKMKQNNESLPIIVNVKQGFTQLDAIQKISYEADLNSTMLYNHLIHTTYGTEMKNDYETPVIKF
jgi:predicted nucleotidyltransferase